MNIETFVVGGLELMSSVGIGIVVKNAAKALTPETTSAVGKACVEVGSFAVAGYMSLRAANYIEQLDKELKNSVNKIKEAGKKKEENPIETNVEVIEEEIINVETEVEEKVFEEVKPKKAKKTMKN